MSYEDLNTKQDTEYCEECSCYVPVDPERGRLCWTCNPSNLGENTYQELDFNDGLVLGVPEDADYEDDNED